MESSYPYNNMKQDQKHSSGQMLLELLLAFALASIILPALLTGFVAAREGKVQQQERLVAVALDREAREAIRQIRDIQWENIETNGTYHPVASGSVWLLSPGAETINEFNRSIVIADAMRDANGNIVATGGSVDPSTKKVTITVSWNAVFPSSVTSVLYMMRMTNLSWIQTTQAEFNAGTKLNAYVTSTNGSPTDGEVTLGAGGGGGDWCAPSLSVSTVDLSRQGVPTAISAYPGNIVTGTGGNASGPTFVKISVTGNAPPTATISGEYNNTKANAVFTENNYGYIATTDHSQEIKILNLSTTSGSPPAYSVVGWFDAPGNQAGDSVFVANNVGYMTDNNNFYTFDMSGHTGARTHLNTSTSWTLAGTGKKVVVVGNYAYVAVDSTTTQLQVIDVTNPSNPTIVASAQTNNGQAGTDVSVNPTGTRAYLVTHYASASQPDVFIFDVSNKTGTLSPLGSGYNTGGMSPKGVGLATGNRVVIVGTGGAYQYQVVNIANETSPVVCSYNGTNAGLAIPGGAFAVSTVTQPDGYAYAYIVTGDTHAELKIILGGAGGQYVSTGTYESPKFSVNSSSQFNQFIAAVSQPPQTTLKLQVAVAKAISGSCNGVTYQYVGPDGNTGQYFTVGSDPTTIQAAVPVLTSGNYANPGNCFRYKAWFTTFDSSATPILYDMTVNYSP